MNYLLPTPQPTYTPPAFIVLTDIMTGVDGKSSSVYVDPAEIIAIDVDIITSGFSSDKYTRIILSCGIDLKVRETPDRVASAVMRALAPPDVAHA